MIIIEKNQKSDSRSCDASAVSKEELIESTKQHISDVRSCLSYFQYMLSLSGIRHDSDKLANIDAFYEAFKDGCKDPSWLHKHRSINRHHLLSPEGVPSDVNLLDVLELISDHIVSGLSRTGDMYPLELNPDILVDAFHNTVDLLKKEIEVIDTDGLSS